MKNLKYGRILFPLWTITCIWGLINLFSASYMYLIKEEMNPFRYVIIQGGIFIGCFIAIFFIVRVLRVGGYYFLRRMIPPLFWFSILSLIAVLIIGVDRGGAKSVIAIGPFDYQPMELYKVAVILYLAHIFDRCQSNQETFLDLFRQLLAPGFGLLLIFLEPDLGGTLICGIAMFIAVLLNGRFIPFIFKIIGAVVAFIVAIVAFGSATFLEGYQMDRFTNWIDPFANAQDESYQTVQSIIGISNGSITGVGYMNSLQKTFLDSGAATDYIFIVICEEWGMFGAVFTIGLLMGIAYICIMIGLRATERFGQIFACSFGALIMIQSFVNIGGVINLIPMTGVTLPFISNGMNSLVFLSFGILCCILVDVKTTHDKKVYKLKQQQLKEEKHKKENLENRRLSNVNRFGSR